MGSLFVQMVFDDTKDDSYKLTFFYLLSLIILKSTSVKLLNPNDRRNLTSVRVNINSIQP